MMMFLPFLIFLIAFIMTVKGSKKSAFYLWLVGIAANVVLFNYHVTDPLNLNF